jgi:glycosyltransferase involved in cell wall biosynthesis
MTSTDISVVIPTHNRHDTLLAAVSSIYKQTVLPGELIVVDDGSIPPVTGKIFSEAPPGLKTLLLRHDKPQGASRARNHGVEEAACQWVAFLDDDDVFLPEKLAHLERAIREHPGTDLFYHPAFIHFVNERVQYVSHPGRAGSADGFFRRMLVRNEVGGTSMVMVCKDALTGAGGFWEEMPALEDYELWLRLARAGARFVRLDQPLTMYVYNTSRGSITKSRQAREQALAMIEKRFARDFRLLDHKEKRRYTERNLRAYVFKALLNLQRRMAFYLQWKVFLHTRKLKDFGLLVAIPFGTRFVIKLRAAAG